MKIVHRDPVFLHDTDYKLTTTMDDLSVTQTVIVFLKDGSVFSGRIFGLVETEQREATIGIVNKRSEWTNFKNSRAVRRLLRSSQKENPVMNLYFSRCAIFTIPPDSEHLVLVQNTYQLFRENEFVAGTRLISNTVP
jgi:hypothetical protein